MEKNNLDTGLFEGMTPEQMRSRMKAAHKKCGSIEDKSAKQKCITQHLKEQIKQESDMKMVVERMGGPEMKEKMKEIQQKCSKYKGDKKAHHQCVMQQMKQMVDKKKVNEATELVDVILTGDYSAYKAINEVDTILDEVENQLDNAPDQDIAQLQKDVVDELSTDSDERDEEEAEDFAEKTVEESMKQSVQLLVTEETYREYFKTMLKKYNINSPSDLEDAKKKEFFDAVDKGWKANKESD